MAKTYIRGQTKSGKSRKGIELEPLDKRAKEIQDAKTKADPAYQALMKKYKKD